MASNERNPYRPGAATPPLYLAGRDAEERAFRKVLNGAPEAPANYRITGLRGVGKTVLLQHFEEIAKSKLNWATVRIQIEPRHNSVSALTDTVVKACGDTQLAISRYAMVKTKAKGWLDTARAALQVEFEDFTFSLGGSVDGPEAAIMPTLYETARIAQRSGKQGFLLMLDEAQVLTDEKPRDGEHPLSMLVAAFNQLQEKKVMAGLVLCGLPTLKANVLKARTYSERMFVGEPVGRLTKSDTRLAFTKPLEGTSMSFDDEALEEAILDVEGYPYFVQLWGAELWAEAHDAGQVVINSDVLNTMRPLIFKRLDHDFYDPRVEALTPAEQDLLISTGDTEYPPLKSANIHGGTKKQAGNVNVLMGRLVEAGVLYRKSKGIYEYTAPKFYEYLERRKTADEWT